LTVLLGVELDGVAEVLELANQVLGVAASIDAGGEVVGAEVLIAGLVRDHVPGVDQDGVPDRDQRPLLSAPVGKSPVLGLQVGIPGPAGSDGGLAERGA
jgi:hypothetical protein